MEKIIITCENCSQKLRIPNDKTIEVTCPTCRHHWKIIHSANGINIAIIGKTGVGKSTFCNYVFNSEVFESGTGKPVTQWNQNFQHHAIEHNGYTLNLLDSVGLEPDNYEKWNLELENFLNDRSFLKTKPTNWLHGVFYLINAASARVEPIEIKIIKNLISNHIPIQVILTNTDQAKTNEIEAIKQQLENIKNKINVSEVCSVEIKTRKGFVKAKGKEEVFSTFLKNLDESLKNAMIIYFLNRLKESSDTLHYKMRKSIENSDIGILKLIREAMNDSNRDFEEIFNIDMSFMDDDIEEVDEALQVIDDFLLSHGYNPDTSAKKYIDNLYEKISKRMDLARRRFESKFSTIENSFKGNISEKISGALEVGRIFINLKKFLLEEIEFLMMTINVTLEDAFKEINGA